MKDDVAAKYFVGRPVLPGAITGRAVVTHQGFNNLASFYEAMVSHSDKAICSDQDNTDLFGKNLSGMIICLPKTIGSTSAGATWDTVISLGIAPKAMLFSEHIDTLAAAGLIMADIWVAKRVVVVDQLGEEFLNYVKDGCLLEIQYDGTVILYE
jgi:predicted aconitase with swiveling domain